MEESRVKEDTLSTFGLTEGLKFRRSQLVTWQTAGLLPEGVKIPWGDREKTRYTKQDVFQIGIFKELFQSKWDKKLASDISQTLNMHEQKPGNFLVMYRMDGSDEYQQTNDLQMVLSLFKLGSLKVDLTVIDLGMVKQKVEALFEA